MNESQMRDVLRMLEGFNKTYKHDVETDTEDYAPAFPSMTWGDGFRAVLNPNQFRVPVYSDSLDQYGKSAERLGWIELGDFEFTFESDYEFLYKPEGLKIVEDKTDE